MEHKLERIHFQNHYIDCGVYILSYVY